MENIKSSILPKVARIIGVKNFSNYSGSKVFITNNIRLSQGLLSLFKKLNIFNCHYSSHNFIVNKDRKHAYICIYLERLDDNIYCLCHSESFYRSIPAWMKDDIGEDWVSIQTFLNMISDLIGIINNENNFYYWDEKSEVIREFKEVNVIDKFNYFEELEKKIMKKILT